MKISRRNFCLLMAGACCTGVLAACGSSSSSTASSSAASASAAASGEVRDELIFVNYRDIRDLNPHLYAGEMYAQSIKENHNTAMIFISHDLNAISRVADRIVVLNHGAVVDRGDFQHILYHAQDPYTKLLVEKRADVMRRYTAVLNGKKETAHA